jgi:hypothetical protein
MRSDTSTHPLGAHFARTPEREYEGAQVIRVPPFIGTGE